MNIEKALVDAIKRAMEPLFERELKELDSIKARLDALENSKKIPERLLTKQEVADFYRITTRSVDDWIAERKIPDSFMGTGSGRRWKFSEIEAFNQVG